jgi:hypothetical protein
MRLFHNTRLSIAIAILVVIASIGVASAQSAYDTDFTTSITYQNVGTGTANINFTFHDAGSATTVQVTRTLAANAGDALFLGSLSQLGQGFQGSAVASADQPIVATVVQVPQGNPSVLNRPLSNGFKAGASQLTFATILKSAFGTDDTTQFSVQNASNGAVDLDITLIDTSGNTIPVERNNVAAGAAVILDAGTLSNITTPEYNGSAVVTAVAAGTTTPANIVGAATELSQNGVKAYAFEAVTTAANTYFVASGLCRLFAGLQETAYAVTNTSLTTPVNVTVTYSDGATDTATLGPGQKKGFLGCGDTNQLHNPPNGTFDGAATITANGPIAVVAKKFEDVSGTVFSTAFNGEAAGTDKLALPYVRWTDDAHYNNVDKRQRTFIAISNVGNAAVGPVTVKYIDRAGSVVGTHTIASIAAGGKATSRPAPIADPGGVTTPTTPADEARLRFFGSPEHYGVANTFGGSAIIEGPAGAQLIVIASVASNTNNESPPATPAKQVQEDYNGIPVD